MSIGSGIKCFDKKRKSRRISFNTIGFTVLKSTSLYFMCPCPWFTPNTFSFTEYFRGSQRAIALFLPRTHLASLNISVEVRGLSHSSYPEHISQSSPLSIEHDISDSASSMDLAVGSCIASVSMVNLMASVAALVLR